MQLKLEDRSIVKGDNIPNQSVSNVMCVEFQTNCAVGKQMDTILWTLLPQKKQPRLGHRSKLKDFIILPPREIESYTTRVSVVKHVVSNGCIQCQ